MTEKENAETKKEEKEVAEAKKTVGIYLLGALLGLIAIGSIVYFQHLSNVLLKTVLYVGVSGGIGGVLYGIRGFIYHIDEDDFKSKYKWWYLYHPVTGFILGEVAYFLIVGGLLTIGSVSEPSPKYLLLYCGVSFLAGFSAKKFNQKLDDLASTIFASSTKPTSTAVSFDVSGFPNPVKAGTSGSVTVIAKDNEGKTVTGYAGTVKITSSDNQATLPSDYTFRKGDKGVHKFTDGVTLKTVGSQSITATDSKDISITGSQTAIIVT
jgi:hypothetical protein